MRFLTILTTISIITSVFSVIGMCPYPGDLSISNGRISVEFSEDSSIENLSLLENDFDAVSRIDILVNRKIFKAESHEVSSDGVLFRGRAGNAPVKLLYTLSRNVLKGRVESENIKEIRILFRPCDFEPLVFRGKDVHFIQGRHVAYALSMKGSVSIYMAGIFTIVKRNAGNVIEFELRVARDVETLRKELGLSGGESIVRTVVDGEGNPIEGVAVAAKVDGRYVSASISDNEGRVEFGLNGNEVDFDVLGYGIDFEVKEKTIELKAPGKTTFRWRPYLTGLTEDSVYIGMRLTRPGTVLVLLDDGRRLSDGLIDTFHMVEIDGIPEGVATILTLDDEATVLLRRPRKDVHFAVYGDTRTNEEWHEMVCRAMKDEDIDFVLHTGDLVESGDLIVDWDKFFHASRDLYSRVSIIPTLGNHERNSPYYYQAFMAPEGGGDYSRRWYSVVLGKLRIIVLDSNVSEGTALYRKQTEWLKGVLSHSGEPFKIVVFHHPFFTNSPNREPTLKEEWKKLFEEYGVQLVLNGHIHHYERFMINGVTYVTTGGGGAPLGFGLKSPDRKHLRGTMAGKAGYLHYVVGVVNGDEIHFVVKSVAEYDWGTLTRVSEILDEFVIESGR